MTANPMQRKARNSFLLGILVTVLIMGLIVALLLWQIIKMKDQENERIQNSKQVYALKSDVKSGDTVSLGLCELTTAENAVAPTNAATPTNITQNTVAKIDLKAGTILTTSMLEESDEKTTNDVRIQEYNMLKLNTQIENDDFIDIRLRMPSGLDYIVVSKKRVEVPEIEGVGSKNTIWVKMSETEILTMSRAIVEAYMMPGSVLYTAKYVEPGLQAVASPTYVPTDKVKELMYKDPNVVVEARNSLFNYYNDNSSFRAGIDAELSTNSEDATDDLTKGVQTEIQNAQEQRQLYLDALAGN